MNRPDRRTILAVGVPGTGKTVLIMRITDAMLERDGYDSIFVLDRKEEWSEQLEPLVGDLEAQLEELEEDEARVEAAKRQRGWEGLAVRKHHGPLIRSADEYDAYCRLLALERRAEVPTLVPRRVIWRCGWDVNAYGVALAAACNQGNVAIVFCEAPDWFTSHEAQWPLANIPGRPDVSLAQLYSQGRAHIKNAAGAKCRIHLICDSQDLAMVHWKPRKFSETVLLSRIEGGESYAVIRREFGDGTDDIVNRVRAISDHEWLAVRGTMPELGPYRGGGRAG